MSISSIFYEQLLRARSSKVVSLFTFLGYSHAKAVHKHVGEIETWSYDLSLKRCTVEDFVRADQVNDEQVLGLWKKCFKISFRAEWLSKLLFYQIWKFVFKFEF